MVSSTLPESPLLLSTTTSHESFHTFLPSVSSDFVNNALSPESSTSATQHDPHPPPPHNTHSMVTTSKDGIFKPKAYVAIASTMEPSNIHESMSIPLRKDIVGTWGLVVPLPNRPLVGCKWLFKNKKNRDSSVVRNKARLVAQGFSQAAGMDYHETFIPVIKS